MAWPDTVAPVALDRAYRLINHGPTVIVSAGEGVEANAMAVAWCCALDFAPPKLTVVLDKATRTRELVEAHGTFAVSVPTVAQAALVRGIGTDSAHRVPDKLQRHGVRWVDAPEAGPPRVAGCVAWLDCRVLPQPALQAAHDLFLAEVTAAWADTRVFRDGRWQFETADDELRTLHHVAGGQFYAIGSPLKT